MNLEQIATSTTAGKAEVMRLAAEGRKLVTREVGSTDPWEPLHEKASEWAWGDCHYAIIAEPVRMEEIWVVVGFADGSFTKQGAEEGLVP